MNNICFIGLGYVGLPTAAILAASGCKVLGVDIDERVVSSLNRGEVHIEEPGLQTVVSAAVKSGNLRVSTKPEAADVFVIAVPTPILADKRADMAYVRAATESILPVLQRGNLVILESTSPPCTTKEILCPILEKSGLQPGTDLYVAYCPERILPGKVLHELVHNDRIIGGINAKSAELAKAVYKKFVNATLHVTDATTAELVKLFENTSRDINIALANEFAKIAEAAGCNGHEAIRLANQHPRVNILEPGPGVGGHCLVGSETVRVRGRGLDTVLPLEDLFVLAQIDSPAYKKGNTEVIEPKGLETLSLDPETGKSVWKPITHLFKNPYQGDMVEVSFGGARELRVTDRHPMLVVEDGRLVTREARDLKVTNRVPQYQGSDLPLEEYENPVVDMLVYLPYEILQKLRVRIRDGHWSNYEKLLKHHFGWTIRDAIRQNTLGATKFLAIEEELGIAREDLILQTGRGKSYAEFPVMVTLTPEFCRLLGYYLSEGCITEEKENPRVRLTFNREETNFVRDVEGLLKSQFNATMSQHHSKTCHATTLRIGSSMLGYLLRDILKTGVASHKMRVPRLVMGASPQHQKQLLSGLLRGDGDVKAHIGTRPYSKNGRLYNHQYNRGEVGYFSSSPELFAQTEHLLQRLAFQPSRMQKKPYLRITGSRNVSRLESFFVGKKAEKLRLLAQHQIRHNETSRDKSWLGCNTIPVKQVRMYQGNEPVYSIEVQDTHTFATTGGVFVHNCIALDPWFLVERYPSLARLTRDAREINDGMVDYLIEKLTSLGIGKGKKVAILGAAYKPDIDDPRESPSERLAEKLHHAGVNIAVHDPLVKRFHFPLVPLEEALAGAEAAILAVHHSAYRSLSPAFIKQTMKGDLFIDARNFIDKKAFREQGIRVYTLGVGGDFE